MEEVQRHSVHTLIFRSLKRTHDMFVSNQGALPEIDEKLEKVRKSIKAKDCYQLVFDRVLKANEAKHNSSASSVSNAIEAPVTPLAITDGNSKTANDKNNLALVPSGDKKPTMETTVNNSLVSAPGMRTGSGTSNTQIIPKKAPTIPKPAWHPPWKLARVISGKQYYNYDLVLFHEERLLSNNKVHSKRIV
ncbi:pleiotropic regulator 1-like [Teleopsis dalmanni]|uniref:pleiotropic regulator 1-like n=1 Tax=Teleopsis dalmanni TaxID=139649 RepID=UPI0018CEAB05|nr:pleiotropic regulator 1-like [Teleopsis dalmanni]